METTVKKQYLTLREFADYVGKGYATIWEWVNQGRVETVEVRAGKKKIRRVHMKEANAVKRKMEVGLWA